MSLAWPHKGIPSGHNLPDRSKSPRFSDVIVRKSGGLPHQESGLVRNDISYLGTSITQSFASAYFKFPECVYLCITQLPGKLTETVRWTVFRRAGYGSTLVQIDRHGDSLPAHRGQHPRERLQAILLIPFSYNASHTKNMPFSTSNIDIIHNNW